MRCFKTISRVKPILALLWVLSGLFLIWGPAARTVAAQAPQPDGRGLRAFHLVSTDAGWVLVDQHLYWTQTGTQTGGQTWKDITPPGLGQSAIRAVFFLDTQRGWLVSTESDAAGVSTTMVAHTSDGGVTWRLTAPALFKPGDVRALVSAAYLTFIDDQTGWLVVKQASSSNFSLGVLFRTDDGGATWRELAMPIGEPVVFVTPEVGWTAGGAAGDDLYRTQDGGQSWSLRSVGRPGPQRFFQLPVFQNAREGVLAATANNGGQAQLELYATQDGGASWALQTSTPLGREIAPGVRLPLAVFDRARWLLLAPGRGQLVRGTEGGGVAAAASRDPLTGGVVELDMATPSVGWGRYEVGTCAAGRCTLETRLLRTLDGGQTWAALALPGGAQASATSIVAPPPVVAPQPQGMGSCTQDFVGHGFDKCEVATLGQAQTWMSGSPYRVMNLYIGGANRACDNTALNATLVAQLGQQGWKFIPTWVGPQSMCWPYATSSRISNDPATAYSQGVSEANAAVDAAAGLGLTLDDRSGSVVYYDLEAYSTADATCREAARSFISGWSGRLRERGHVAAVYSLGPPLSTFAGVANVPDTVWPANWYYNSGDPRGVYDPSADVWDVYGLANDLWVGHQRIRQYAGGHDETWSGVTLNIDCDVTDGDVAAICTPVEMRIDAPADGQFIQEGITGITIHGWAIHPAATSGTGVDAVQIYLDGLAGSEGQELGAVTYGDERADVAATYGERYRYSGYHFDWDITGVSSGLHVLYVYVHSTVSGWSYTARRIAMGDGVFLPLIMH